MMGCACELNLDEIEVLRSIFRIILKHGKSPTMEELRLSLKRSDEEITKSLDELEKKGDIILRKKGTQEIVSIYPFSLKPTQHRIILEDGTELFAMCAVDALGVPMMLNRNVKIVSRCEECWQEMTFEIKNGKIARMSHSNATICSPKTQVYPAAETTCPQVNFFCSRKHASEWLEKNPKLTGNVNRRSVKQGFPRIQACWKQYGEMLGFR
jgi:hypothetical protein